MTHFDPAATEAVILFGHGGRSPAWAETLSAVAALLGDAMPQVPIRLAFLELLSPDLATCVAELAQDKAERIHIVPLFIASSGHIDNELVPLVATLQKNYPHIALRLAPVIGQMPGVRQAMCQHIIEWMAEHPGAASP